MDEKEKWLNGIIAEVGTVLGPNARNQFFTVKEVDVAGKRVLVRRAVPQDMVAVKVRTTVDSPRSLGEYFIGGGR